jgi:drug/metabolite transporter (DMT)-like permease
MRKQDWIRFITLCLIWSSSFAFIRICSPVLGPVLTAAGRLGIAGVVLVIYLRLIGFDSQWRTYRGIYFRIGLIGSAIPFMCFAVGALKLPASLLGILNACTPLFGAIFAALWLGEGFGWKRALGVALGLIGVTLANGLGNVELSTTTVVAMLITLIAPLCYALSGIYIKLRASHLPSKGIAAWSQLSVAPLVLLGLPAAPPISAPTLQVVVALLLLSLIGSALAYLLFYRLLADIGPTKCTTVTFILPVFAMVWGVLLLDETITAGMVLGCAILIVGTLLVLAPCKSTS